ncbi:MAG: class I SAM-dependent methyltransferase [Paracoccaceae bacterium]
MGETRIEDDLFGQALWEHWQGRGRGALTVRRKDGHADTASPAVWIGSGVWPVEAMLIERARGRVLDIGCGAGRHLVPLMARGLPVTGLDRSAGALRVARARGGRDLIEGSVFETPIPAGRYDTVLLLGNNLGLAGGVEATLHLLALAARAMTRTGRLLLVSTDVSRAERPIHVIHRACNRAAGRPQGHQTLRIEYAGRVSDWFPWLHLAPSELSPIAARAGLRIARLDRTARGPYAAVLSRADGPHGRG